MILTNNSKTLLLIMKNFLLKLFVPVFSLVFLTVSVSVASADQIKVGSFVSAKGFGSRFVIMPWMERANAALKEIGSDKELKAYWD